MKKIIGIILAMAISFTLIPNVFAYSDVSNREDITLLSDLGIIDGFENGTFRENEILTRAEMAKIMCKLLDLNIGNADRQIYNDVPLTHWAIDYINAISNLNIINGYGDGNYGPEDTVTYEQAIKMIVCALGYEYPATAQGGWPSGYMSVANSIGILKNVVSSKRGDIATLVYNALHTPVMEQTSFGLTSEYKPLDGTNGTKYKTILTKRNIYLATGIVGDIINNERINFSITRNSEDQEFEKGNIETFYFDNLDIASYSHQLVEAYVTKDRNDDYTIVAINAASKAETMTIISDMIKSVDDESGSLTYYLDDNHSKTKTIKLNIGDKLVREYNKRAVNSLEDILMDSDNIEITFVENSGDDRYDAIIMVKYTSEKLTKIDANKNKITLNSKTVEFDFDDATKTYIFVDDNGQEISLLDFEKDDVIAWYADAEDVREASYIKIIRLTNSIVEGSISSVYRDKQKVTIDDVEYSVLDRVWNTETFAPGTEGVFYIGLTGKIVAYDDAKVKTSYGYILNAGLYNSYDDTKTVKMLTENGIKTYSVRKNVALADYETSGIFNQERFVKYKINSSGLISSITNLATTEFENSIYHLNTEILYGKYLDKNTQLFILDAEHYEDSYVTDISYLADEGSYSGAMYVNTQDEVKVVFITNSDTKFNNKQGIAIVTDIGTTVKDEETVFEVCYVQDEEENSIYFEDYTFEQGAEIFAIGTTFVFKADANNYVRTNDYKIVTAIEDNNFIEVNTADIGKDVTIVTGYIENEQYKENAKGELITIDETVYVISADTNKYTYINNKKNKIEIGDFLSGNAYYAEEDSRTPAMLKLVDGVVVDIYTISIND